ncbi:phosphoenolpyruvate--protein phosphotransferase [Reinekea blandensis]|uniref:phosphoenolpyruvate--protein phosphotransferase n=1 Tax=Reinekea blandensis MED297 TaxID=314283 RepID=A4BDK4_9GAMM|nr:phosphoenolpyruvate--protein phosphotransferase [Reinekea blandensis]EAR09948.1 phosphoenolpyruvate-protein phosphotransferase [Reinekea sp. MED297] [Reinekea blandensis MED297]
MNAQTQTLRLIAPLSGVLKPIEQADDPVFAQRLVGDGCVIDPADDTLLAPFDGEVTQLHDAHHAVAIRHNNGVEVLMHIGVDTVTLKGDGFEPLVSKGDRVTQGQALIRFSRPVLDRAQLSVQSAVLLTTGQTVPGEIHSRNVKAGQDEIIVLSAAGEVDAEPSAGQPTGPVLTGTVVIRNPQGLHARPAARLVQAAKAFDAQLTVTRIDDGRETSGHSVTGLLGLQTQNGTELTLTVSGAQAQAALDAVTEAINAGLGETITQAGSESETFPEEPPLLKASDDTDNRLRGVKAAGGLAIGALQFRDHELPSFPQEGVAVEEELGQLKYGLLQAHKTLDALIQRLEDRRLGTQADVFRAHAELLQDPALIDAAQNLIRDGASAMYAWEQACLSEAARLRQMDAPLLQARASDIDDIRLSVLQSLIGIQPATDNPDRPTVLVLDDLTPSEVVALDTDTVVGVATLAGGATSHAAILAASVGLPYLVNLDPAIRSEAEGTVLILNADEGWVEPAPDEQDVARWRAYQHEQLDRFTQAQAEAALPATTTDGVLIEVAANAASVEQAQQARAAGADGIGLVRSEFLYLDRASEPGFDEQVTVYRDLLAAIGRERPCIIRTLDVGGDKPLPYLPMPAEENPFLGERGVRIGLNKPHLLRKQIRAILVAADGGPVRIMFPMIASLEEFRAVRQLVQDEQDRAGNENVDVGVMIEVPSAAVMADMLAPEVDFFSIGTNDLTQYTLAMDRGHPKLAAQVDALHPAVLRLIHQTARAGQQHGKWTGICGSLASDPEATALLIGLGVTELSTSLPALPLVKARVRQVSLEDSERLAKQAMRCANAAEVRALLS